MTLEPILLPPAAFDHFYLGGANIAALRGNEPGERRPEEWLGSTVRRWGEPENGLTRIGDAVDAPTLRDLIEADPVGWLGAAHVDRWGTTPAVLVKLLDAGQRLPVHVHPTRSFARSHLDCDFGKTEAWVVLEGEQSRGTVYVGTHRPVAPDEWAEMVDAQATTEMLALLNPIDVGVGDVVVVPSGTPHSTGEGLFVLELQEPTDFSLLLEWDGFAIDGRADGHLDLGYKQALEMVRRDALSGAQLDALVRRHGPQPSSGLVSLMPSMADPYFRAWSLAPDADPVSVPAGFGILLITAGNGFLRRDMAPTSSAEVRRGEVYVVPAGSAPLTLAGEVTALFAQPPAGDAPNPVEWDEHGA